jgi:subtilisin family serine protease
VFAAKRFLLSRYERGFTDGLLAEIKYENDAYLTYRLNPDFEPRSLVGDNPAVQDGVYGNPDVKGPRADHGTGVAGVIAGLRNNNIGVDGIADVKIMCLRTTPDGDERDKDVANAIRYAADNGARIINMSFGKDFSPEKKLVDDAVKYAEKKNVLLVHGAGNDGENLDEQDSYPSPYYLDNTKATNWITIGGSDAVANESLPASFSNYSKTRVDLFAPGVNIIMLDTANTYSMHDGTSFSAPVVSGVAALVLSYHPNLTPQQLIDILMSSSIKMEKLKVLKPSPEEKRKKARFKDLSRSAGVVDAYAAMKKADAMD